MTMKSTASLTWISKYIIIAALVLMAMLSMSYATVTTHVETDKITVDDVVVTNDVNATEFYQNGNKVLDTTDNTTMTNYVDAQDAVYNESMKTYVDAQDATYNTSIKTYADNTFLKLIGGTLAGAIAMGNNHITGINHANGTSAYFTNGYFTNLYGLSDINLENNLDGTGYTITGGTLTDGTVSINAGSITGVAGLTATTGLDIGAYDFRALSFTSDVATGTAPLTIASATVVANLNSSYANESYSMDWVGLKTWPPACSSNYGVTGLDDTVTCSDWWLNLDGSNSPSATINWGNQQLINASNVSSTSFTDGAATLTGGSLTGIGSLTTTANIDIGAYEFEANTLTFDYSLGNITDQSGNTRMGGNATCTFIYSPDGSTIMEICNS